MAMKLNFRTVFWGSVIIALIALFVLALQPQAVPVDIEDIGEGPLVVTVRDEGYSRIREVYTLSAPVSGRLLRVEREPGDRVEPEAVLARLVPVDPSLLDVRADRTAQAALAAAEAARDVARADALAAVAQRELAETEAARYRTLYTNGTVAQEAVDRTAVALRTAQAQEQTARASVRMREAEVAAALAQLNRLSGDEAVNAVLEIHAPTSGQVLRVHQESETVVQAGAPILDLGDPYGLEIVAEMLSEDAVRIEPGARVEIAEWDGTDRMLRGRVRLVEPLGFEEVSALGVREQRVNVIIDLMDPEEDWRGLGHGFRVEAAIVLWEAEAVLRVPVSSLFRQDGAWHCFVAEQGRARLRQVEIGHLNDQYAEILNGLSRGEAVVLYASDSVSDGARLTPR